MPASAELSNRLDAATCERIRHKIAERVPIPDDEVREAAAALTAASPTDIAHRQRLAQVCDTVGDGYIKLLANELARRQRLAERRLVRQMARALRLEYRQ